MTRPFNTQAIIVANNRPDYLERTTAAFRKYHPHIPCIVVNDDHQEGMAANVQRAWSWALNSGCDWILHIEDDMEILSQLPIRAAQHALTKHSTVAQMVFKRHIWWGSEPEMRTGDVISAICEAPDSGCHHHRDWTEHSVIFSLNPCLIPRHIIQLGWPSGALGIGNESGMTTKLQELGYTFGMWGQPGDTPLIEHIGHERGPGWKL